MIEIGKIRIAEEELTTHIHGIGLSRSGKSKLIELICRQLAMKGRGFCFIDPHAKTCNDLIEYFAMLTPTKRVWLFESSNRQHVAGFYPFALDPLEEDYIYTKAERMLAATMRAWDVSDPTKTPRLSKWLRRIYYTLIEQQLNFYDAECFLEYSQSAKRNAIIAKIQNPSIKTAMQKLYEKKPEAIESYLESTESRLEVFRHPHVRRIMSIRENSLDLRGIINRQEILLVNLQHSNVLSLDNTRVLGTLLINELWNLFVERGKKAGLPPYYLIVDECQLYATPDISAMLDQAAGFGLHLMLFHQRKGQIAKDVSEALENAQTNFIFSTQDERKEQRQFTFVSRAGEELDAEVPEVKRYPLSESSVQAYKKRLLKGFMSAQEIDAILQTQSAGSQRPKSEVTEDDLYRE